MSNKDLKIEQVENKNKNENVDIFVYSHIPFTPIVNNSIYKVLTNNHCEDSEFHTNLPIYRDYEGEDNISKDNLVWNEYSGFYWLWKNYPLKDYIGMNHYRRYYNFLNDVPDINLIFKFGYKIILNKKFPLAYNGVTKNNREFYSIWHNVEDFDLMGKIVKENYPQYADGWDKMANSEYIYPSSIFIMNKETFIKYCEYIFDVCNKFNDERNCHTSEEWIDYVTKNQDKYIHPLHLYYDIKMQSRVIGYLIERCLAAFLMSGGDNSLESKSVQYDWSMIK